MSTATLPAVPDEQGPTAITARIDHNAVLKAVGLNLSDPNAQALLLTCERYGLDPILKHMVLIQGRPYVTRDGLLHVAHCSGQFDGIEVIDQGENQSHFTAKVAVYRKDMGRPFTYIGRYPKNGGNKNYGPEMAVKCGEVMGLRRAFNVALCAREEVWDQDTGHDYVEVTAAPQEDERRREINQAFHRPQALPRDEPDEPMPAKRDETWAAFVARVVRTTNDDWQGEMAIEGVDEAKRENLISQYSVMNTVCTRAIEAKVIQAGDVCKDGKPEARDQTKAAKAVSDLFTRMPGKVRKTVEKYVAQKRQEARAALGMFDPEAQDDTAPQDAAEEVSQEPEGREPGEDG